jgi:hypothetical protein
MTNDDKPANKGGRPTILNDRLIDEVCVRLSQGVSMRSVCRDDDMPCMATIWRWLRENDNFAKRYTAAKQESADAMIEDILAISDQDDEEESTNRSRLRVDTRKWIAAKLRPEKYSEKLDLTPSGGTVKITIGGKSTTEEDSQESDSE